MGCITNHSRFIMLFLSINFVSSLYALKKKHGLYFSLLNIEYLSFSFQIIIFRIKKIIVRIMKYLMEDK